MSTVTGRPSRAVLVEHVRELRALGMTFAEIADALGVSYTYAQGLFSDPDRTKEIDRKNRYRGTCRVCGASTDGSNGRAKAPSICNDCYTQSQHEERYWTAETIVESFRAFRDLMGRSPTTIDANGSPSILVKLSEARVHEINVAREAMDALGFKLPHRAVVYRECGSWDGALMLAGLPPNPSGGAGHR